MMPNKLTPRDQNPQTGPNFCPFCDYWHPVASMVTGHVGKEHRDRMPHIGGQLLHSLAEQEKRAGQLDRMKARKAARDNARKEAS